jgi:hypothetical protein
LEAQVEKRKGPVTKGKHREKGPGNARRRALTLEDARQVLAISVPLAARLAGVSDSAMYLACERGEVESIRLCGRILVLSAPFLRRFGLEADD